MKLSKLIIGFTLSLLICLLTLSTLAAPQDDDGPATAPKDPQPKDAVPPPQNQPKDAPQNPKDATPLPNNPNNPNNPEQTIQTTPVITLTSTSFFINPTTTMLSNPINSPTFIPKQNNGKNNGKNNGNPSSDGGSATKTIVIVASVIGGLIVLGGAAMAIFRYQKSISSDWNEEGEVVLRDGGEDLANGNPFKNTLDQYHI